MSNILVIYYTQTGQLRQILDSMLSPLSSRVDITIDFLEIKPIKPFPFPWTRREFLNAFPETYLETPIELEPLPQHGEFYDLIILAFQPWFLSPSPPVASFLKSPAAQILMAGTPILTVIGSRNMWQGAYSRVREMVTSLGGRLCGIIAFNDRAPNLISAITIVYWLFTGKKDRLLGFFPRPGVSDGDIVAAAQFGPVIGAALSANRLNELARTLEERGAAEMNASLARLENRARRVFGLWARFIARHPGIRPQLLDVFFVELVLALAIVSPLNSLFGRAVKWLKK